jgi:hypothetical protein
MDFKVNTVVTSHLSFELGLNLFFAVAIYNHLVTFHDPVLTDRAFS